MMGLLQQYARDSIYSSARHKIAQRGILNWFLMRNWKSKSIRESTHSFAMCRMHSSLIGKITLLHSLCHFNLLAGWSAQKAAKVSPLSLPPPLLKYIKYENLTFFIIRARSQRRVATAGEIYREKKSGVV